MNSKWKHAPKRATFHSFVSTLDLWKVVDIKTNEKPERATTSNEKQQKAAKSNKEQQKANTDIRAGKTKTGNKRHKKVQMETRQKETVGLCLVPLYTV